MDNIAIILLAACFLGLTISFFIKSERKETTFAFGMMALVIAIIFYSSTRMAFKALDEERNHSKYQPVNEQLYRRVDSTTTSK
jgi:uncharacterized membrane protein YjfL (UPF0719 family)